ncbi:MAG: hypothetical protein JO021_23505 [Alphaproteobacteria bacterium]|nr:hypothetical protein [Alphaproteobacteria bacterium]
MRSDLFWRRLVSAYRRQRQRRAASPEEKAKLAGDLLDTLSPSVLLATGYLRHRRVMRRRVTYARLRTR